MKSPGWEGGMLQGGEVPGQGAPCGALSSLEGSATGTPHWGHTSCLLAMTLRSVP